MTTPETLPDSPERIWLEDAAAADTEEGRTWCDHNAWDEYPECRPVEYVRADLVRADTRPAPVSVHPDDEAVDRFAAAMKAKMARSREKGRYGWDDPEDCPTAMLVGMLHEHVHKTNSGAFEDIACLAMMLHQRGDDPSALSAIQPAHAVEARERVREALVEAIGGDAYDCTRVWEAWSVGTMTDDDFEPIISNDERMEELVSAALAAYEEGQK